MGGAGDLPLPVMLECSIAWTYPVLSCVFSLPGNLHRRGEGVEKDLKMAVEYYEKGIEYGKNWFVVIVVVIIIIFLTCSVYVCLSVVTNAFLLTHGKDFFVLL